MIGPEEARPLGRPALHRGSARRMPDRLRWRWALPAIFGLSILLWLALILGLLRLLG